MAAAVARAPAFTSRSSTPPPSLSLNTSTRGTPAAVPNKHIPICSPGPRPDDGLQTPPASPPNKESVINQTSLLHPPEAYSRLSADGPVYSISAAEVARAIDYIATQPLPDPKQVFPWMHGLHQDNQLQLAFFVQRRKALRKTPKCIRGISIVKVGGDLSHSKLRGAIAPEEVLTIRPPGSRTTNSSFLEIDPREGFSVRNFQIQACKMARLSDIIVYADDETDKEEATALARKIAQAQKCLKAENKESEPLSFNTFLVSGEAGFWGSRSLG